MITRIPAVDASIVAYEAQTMKLGGVLPLPRVNLTVPNVGTQPPTGATGELRFTAQGSGCTLTLTLTLNLSLTLT